MMRQTLSKGLPRLLERTVTSLISMGIAAVIVVPQDVRGMRILYQLNERIHRVGMGKRNRKRHVRHHFRVWKQDPDKEKKNEEPPLQQDGCVLTSSICLAISSLTFRLSNGGMSQWRLQHACTMNVHSPAWIVFPWGMVWLRGSARNGSVDK